MAIIDEEGRGRDGSGVIGRGDGRGGVLASVPTPPPSRSQMLGSVRANVEGTGLCTRVRRRG